MSGCLHYSTDSRLAERVRYNEAGHPHDLPGLGRHFWEHSREQQMAAQGESEHAKTADASNAVWPPPPTYPAPEPFAPRRSRLIIPLPLPQMPLLLRVTLLHIVFISALLRLEHDLPLAGKIMIGLWVAVYSLFICTWLSYCTKAVKQHLSQEWQPLRSYKRTAWRKMPLALGGWMGLVPFMVFWIWGLFFLSGKYVPFANRVALIFLAAWFLLGCIVAVVNGVRHWLKERRTQAGVSDADVP